MAIRDLPLNPSKRHPGWRRHQRNDQQQQQGQNGRPQMQLQGMNGNGNGSMQQQMMGRMGMGQNGKPGGNQGKDQKGGGDKYPKPLPPIDEKVQDRLISQINAQFKGRPLQEKLAQYRKLAEAHVKGDGSPTMMHGIGRAKAEGYLDKFRDLVDQLPQQFDEFVPASVKQAGDNYLRAAKGTSYDMDAYGVGKTNEYSRYLRGGRNILYHQYVQHGDHGLELLRRLSTLGLEVPYEVTTTATSVMWKSEWGEEPEIQLDTEGDDQIGRSVQYAIAFKPRDEGDATKLMEFFERNAKKGKDTIPHSWFVPDIRSTFEIDEFQKNVLNVKRMGEFELLLLKKEAVRGFQPYDIWLNADLSKFIKSLAILVMVPYQIPIAIGQAMNKSFRRMKRVGGKMVPIFSKGGQSESIANNKPL